MITKSCMQIQYQSYKNIYIYIYGFAGYGTGLSNAMPSFGVNGELSWQIIISYCLKIMTDKQNAC